MSESKKSPPRAGAAAKAAAEQARLTSRLVSTPSRRVATPRDTTRTGCYFGAAALARSSATVASSFSRTGPCGLPSSIAFSRWSAAGP